MEGLIINIVLLVLVMFVGFCGGIIYDPYDCPEINCADVLTSNPDIKDQPTKVIYQYRPETNENQIVWKFSAKANETIELRIAKD